MGSRVSGTLGLGIRNQGIRPCATNASCGPSGSRRREEGEFHQHWVPRAMLWRLVKRRQVKQEGVSRRRAVVDLSLVASSCTGS